MGIKWPVGDNMEYGLNREPNEYSERIVVDEILYGDTVRLLRARYRPGENAWGIGIGNWGRERIDFMKAWQIEAFVGYRTKVKLQEGDVFFVVDGRGLNSKYEPIERKRAREEHLLVDFTESGRLARLDMQREYSKLSMAQAAKDNSEREKLLMLVEKAIPAPIEGKGKRNA